VLQTDSPRRLLRIVLGVAALLGALGSPARAEPAAGQLQLGIRSYTRGDYPRAVELLGAATRTTRDSRQLAQAYLFLGFSHSLLQQPEQARAALAAALLHDPDLQPDARRFKSELLELFAAVRRGLGLLEVSSDQPTARVVVDGQELGGTPLRCRLPAGAHRVELRAETAGQVRTVSIAPGASAKVFFSLRVALASAPVAAPPGFWQRRRVWTWVTLGGAALATVVGIGLGARARSTYDNDWGPMRDAYLRGQASREDLQSLSDSITAKGTAANVLFGVGGALAVTSVVLLFVEGRGGPVEGPPPAPRAAWRW
jgi:hypothetical protein